MGVSVDFGDFDVVVEDSGFEELVPAYFPEVEVLRAWLKRPIFFWDLCFVVSKLSAFRPETWRDADEEVLRFAAILLLHELHGIGVDIENAAFPAAVNGGQSMAVRIVEDGGLTVGVGGDEADVQDIGDEAVAGLRDPLVGGGNGDDLIAVGNEGADQAFDGKVIFCNFVIAGDGVRAVSNM